MDDESKDENAKSLAALIPELYKLAIKTNQIKFDVEEVPEKADSKDTATLIFIFIRIRISFSLPAMLLQTCI